MRFVERFSRVFSFRIRGFSDFEPTVSLSSMPRPNSLNSVKALLSRLFLFSQPLLTETTNVCSKFVAESRSLFRVGISTLLSLVWFGAKVSTCGLLCSSGQVRTVLQPRKASLGRPVPL